MLTWLDIYWTMYKTALANAFQYRAAMFIWLLGGVIEPVVYMLVWIAVANAQGGVVNGMSAGDFAAYFITGMVINHFMFSWIIWEYEFRIREGTLSTTLMRPVHPIHQDIADNMAYKTLTSIALLPTAILLFYVFEANFNTSVWSFLACLPAIALAFVLRFSCDWSVAMVAFWTTRNSAINELYYLLFLLLSGKFAPLTLFPDWAKQIANVLPFRWMFSFPLDLALGKLTTIEALTGFAMQLLWIGVAQLVLRAVWSRGLRKFSAVGS